MRQAARALGRWQDLLWMAILVGLLVWRWPVLKGYYYRIAHIEAPASTIPWRADVDGALAEARRTGRPVLVDFSASWCPPCIAMKHDTWTDRSVERAVTAGFVPLLIDVDADPATASRYHVDGIPTVLLLDGSGRVVRRAGFLPPSGVLRLLNGD